MNVLSHYFYLKVLLLFTTISAFSQTDYYTFGSDPMTGKERLFDKPAMEKILNTQKTRNIPGKEDSELVSVIFHKETRSDSIINYVNTQLLKKDRDKKKRSSLEYVQNPLWSHKNKKFPEFAIKDYNGQLVSSNDMTNKPMIINIWGTFCKPCIEEMPILNSWKEKYNDKINFLSMTADSKEVLEKFFEKHNFEFTHLIDQEAKAYYEGILGVTNFPTILFIDTDGVLQHIENGIPIMQNEKGEMINSEGVFENYIEELIATKS